MLQKEAAAFAHRVKARGFVNATQEEEGKYSAVRAPVMIKKSFDNPKARCKGRPGPADIGKKGIWGDNWNNLGVKLSEQQCQDACLDEPLCKFAVYHQQKKHCTAFDKCDSPKVDIYKGEEQRKGKIISCLGKGRKL